MRTFAYSRDARLLLEGPLYLKHGKSDITLRQARLFRDPRGKPSLRCFRLNDRARLATIFSHTFVAQTVVESAVVDLEDDNTWIKIRNQEEVVIQCRGESISKTNLWKEALTSAMVMTSLLVSMMSKSPTAGVANAGTVILKSVYMIRAPRAKNTFRRWYEVKRIPSSESRRTIFSHRSAQRVKEIFFYPKLELHEGDLVLVLDRAIKDVNGKESYHKIKLRSPYEHGYVNVKFLEAAYLPESQAGLIKFLTPSVRKFLLHGTLADWVSSEPVHGISAPILRGVTPRARPTPKFSFPAAPDEPATRSTDAASDLPRFSMSSAALPMDQRLLSLQTTNALFRKRSMSIDECGMISEKASRGVYSKSSPMLVPPKPKPKPKPKQRSRPRLQSNVRQQHLVRIAIKTQLQNKKGLAAHGRKWLKTIKGQMEKFTAAHGPSQKRLYEALQRTPAERRQNGEILDEEGIPISEEGIKILLTDALAEMSELL